MNRLAPSPNDDARLGRVNGNVHLIGIPFNLDARNARARQLLTDMLTDETVLFQQLGVPSLLSVPPRVPIPNDAQAKTYWMYFATQNSLLPVRSENDKVKSANRLAFSLRVLSLWLR